MAADGLIFHIVDVANAAICGSSAALPVCCHLGPVTPFGDGGQCFANAFLVCRQRNDVVGAQLQFSFFNLRVLHWHQQQSTMSPFRLGLEFWTSIIKANETMSQTV